MTVNDIVGIESIPLILCYGESWYHQCPEGSVHIFHSAEYSVGYRTCYAEQSIRHKWSVLRKYQVDCFNQSNCALIFNDPAIGNAHRHALSLSITYSCMKGELFQK